VRSSNSIVALGLGDLAEQLELGALRRRATGRQLQLHGLGHDTPSEAQHPCCGRASRTPHGGRVR
jgi:hypothetical protein